MIKAIFSKLSWVTRGVLWLAKGTSILVGLTVMVALTAGVVSTATAANGGNFILGSLNNAATAITKLTGTVAGPALQVVNPSTGTGATALDLQVASGKPPMKVNSGTKVTNLNADKVDGQNLSCPSGTLFQGGYCFEAAPRGYTSDFLNANEECIGEGKRLADLAELQSLRSRSGSTFKSWEWTNEHDYDGTLVQGVFFDPALPAQGNFGSKNGNYNFRCVSLPG